MLYRADHSSFSAIQGSATEVESSGEQAFSHTALPSNLKTPKVGVDYLANAEMTSTPKQATSIMASRFSTPLGGSFSTPKARPISTIYAAPASLEATTEAPMSYSTPIRKQVVAAPKQVLAAKPTAMGAKRAFVSALLLLYALFNSINRFL